MIRISQKRCRDAKETVSRVLRLERLESRQLLSANPFAFSVKNDGIGHDDSQSHEYAGNRLADSRSREVNIAPQQQSARESRSLSGLDHGHSDRQRSGSNQSPFHNDAPNTTTIDRAFNDLDQAPRTDPPSQASSTTSIQFLVVTFTPSSFREGGSLTSISPPTATSQNRKESRTASSSSGSATASDELATPTSIGEVLEPTSLVSLAPRVALVASERLTADNAIASFPFQRNSLPRTTVIEVHEWLDNAEELQDKFSELDRTLQELAEEQSLSTDLPRQSRPRRPQNESNSKTETPSSDWLNQTNSIIVAAAAATRAIPFAQADIDSKLAGVTTAGWNIGIGLYRTFETSQHTSDVVLASIDAAPWKAKSSEDESQQDQTLYFNNPMLIGIAITAVTAWRVHQLQVQREHRILFSTLGR